MNPKAYPCPAGTFNPNNGSKHKEECLPCPRGYVLILFLGRNPLIWFSAFPSHFYSHFYCYTLLREYCQGGALVEPSGKCAGGWFCLEGSNTPQPAPHQNFSKPVSVIQSYVHNVLYELTLFQTWLSLPWFKVMYVYNIFLEGYQCHL